jgi:carbon monoxide dehydrogenase subunit G
MLIDGQFTVAAPPPALMRHLFDARLMAECLPGCESLEALDADRYRAVVAIALAGVKARFELQVEVTRREALAVWATTRGEEGGNASQLQADNRIVLEAVPEGTRLRYESEVAVTGRLGRFALGMMKKKAQALGDEFAQNLQARLTALEAVPVAAPAAPPEPAPAAAQPWWRVVWNWLTGRTAPAPRPGG